MPVGPLALTDETAIDLAQKIMKQTIRDLGEKAVDPDQMALIDTLVDKHGRFGRKNGKGFYDYPAEAGEEEAVAGPEGPLSAAGARKGRRRGAEAALPRHHRAGGGARHGGGHRHRSARGRCRLDPRLRLRALYRRRAVLHRRHRREEVRQDRQGAAEEIRRASSRRRSCSSTWPRRARPSTSASTPTPRRT